MYSLMLGLGSVLPQMCMCMRARAHTHAHTQEGGISCTYDLATWSFPLTGIPVGHVNNYIIFRDVNGTQFISFSLTAEHSALTPSPLATAYHVALTVLVRLSFHGRALISIV